MHMIDLQLYAEQLVRHAEANGESYSGDEDLGYTVHSWLKAAFGDSCPYPFRIIGRPMERVRVLAYSGAGIKALREHAEMYATPLTVRTCSWEDSASKSLEDLALPAGQVLGFEVRVCPIVRSDEGERDAFLAALPEDRSDRDFGREDIYRRWIVRRMREYVDVEEKEIRLSSFRLVSAVRKNGSGKSGGRKARKITLPDALMDGTLRVRDEGSLHDLLARGVGRHRAFGFGMVLLRSS